MLNAAIRLADRDGIESVTMRSVGRALGVEAMSLYNHVANKPDLMDGIVDLVVGEIALPPATEDCVVAIREYAISAHQALLRHPWACSLLMSATTPQIAANPRLRNIEWLLGRLRTAGFSPDLTYHAYHALDSHVLGFTLWQVGHSAAAKDLGRARRRADLAATFLRELRASGYPYLAEHAEQHVAAPGDDGDREFEFGLDLILDGLESARQTA